MALNDPLGDMIARIHNAQMRNKPKVSLPASRLRASVLDVLKSEGFIRGYASVERPNGRNEIEIEVKYFDGAPVISKTKLVWAVSTGRARKASAILNASTRFWNASGIDLAVTKEIESFGTRSIILTKYETGIHVGRRSREERMRKELTYDDAMAMKDLPHYTNKGGMLYVFALP